MEEENKNEEESFLDISRYSEKTRKVIFGIVVALILAIAGVAMFIISPNNEASLQTDDNNASATQAPVDGDETASQAPVNNETTESENSSGKPDKASPREEAITPEEDVAMNDGEIPKSPEEEAAKAQEKIIEESLKRKEEMTDEVVEDFHPVIKDSPKLQDIASKGMLAYCTDKPDETKQEKQARMKPYFHSDSAGLASPSSLFYLTKCSVEAVTDPSHDENENIVVNVGVAWGAQLQKDGSANTGYTQYRVILDKDGIISFND